MTGTCAIARAKLARKVAELRKAGSLEKTTTAIKAGFVGSIVTPMRAVVGNASWGGLRHLALQPLESGVDYLLSVGKSARTRFRVKPHEFREIANALDADGVGVMWRGFKKGTKPISEAYGAAKAGGGPIRKRVAAFVEELSTRLEAEQIANVLDVERVKYSSPVSQTLVDGAFAILEAADRPFWKMAYDGSVYMQGKLMAIREGLKGAEAKARAAELFEAPTDEMAIRAADDANYATFKDRNVLSRGATTVKRYFKGVANKAPDPALEGYARTSAQAKQRGGKIASYIIETNLPFTGVPSSVAAKIASMSPLGFFSHNVLGSQAARARALATAGMGTAVMAVGYALAKKGLVTQGLPNNPKERAQWDEQGKQPWSVKIGKEWVGLMSLGPVSAPIFLGAKLAEVRENPEAGLVEQAAQTAAGAGKFLTQQTYLQQVGRIVDAMGDENKAVSLVASQIPLPAAGGQINRAIDPVVRDTKSLKDRILTRIPGLSRFSPPKLTPTGKTITRSPEERIAAVVSPLPLKRSIESPLLTEMERLGVTFGMPSRTITHRGKKILLGAPEYREMLEAGGPRMQLALENLMKRPGYAEATDEQKAKAMERVIERSRDRARAPVKFEAVSRLIAAQRDKSPDPVAVEMRLLGIRPLKTEGEKAVALAVMQSDEYRGLEAIAEGQVKNDPKFRGKSRFGLARELRRGQIEGALASYRAAQ